MAVKEQPRYTILGQNDLWQKIDQDHPLAAIGWNSYIKIDPTPKQLAFLLLPCEEAFYGGAAGGGKSVALLAAALQYVHMPRYAAILFRKTFTDLSLPGALMDVAQQWLGSTDARWHDKENTWTFPSGATLTFGYLDGPSDRFRYQSSEFQFVGFDELTQFEERNYLYLFSRLRRLEGSSIPIRMRSASNPGGYGHSWVKQRMIIEQRPFIPARLSDNPHLDQKAYIRSLSKLDAVTRRQLLDGDWNVIEGGLKFNRGWFQIIDSVPADLVGKLKSARYWDLAATAPKKGRDPDYTVGVRLSRAPDGIYYLTNLVRLRDTPHKVEDIIKRTALMDTKQVSIYIEQEPGSSGINTIDNYTRKVLPGFIFKGIRSTGSKEERANPVSSMAEAGNIKLVSGPWIGSFLDEAEVFPQGEHDDQVDALSGAFAQLTEVDTSFEEWMKVMENKVRRQSGLEVIRGS